MTVEGDVINERYRLDRVIGRGGMADVWAGHDGLLDRPVAVKVPLPAYRDDDRFVRRFAKEARAAAALNHPNVVSVFDRGDDGEVPYLVMELVVGSSLRALIDSRGFTETEALTIARDVCAGLEYAHQHGFVHRDLKPDNVLITEDGVTKVTDFGIVRAIGDRSITSTRPLGSVAYVSPEQATGRDVDARSDLYSLGIVLYEMLTGTRPFDADSPVSIALAHIESTPTPPRDVVGSISPAAEAVVLRALQKDPDDRFDSAAEMREALELALAGAGEPATAVLPTGPSVSGDATTAGVGVPGDDPTMAIDADDLPAFRPAPDAPTGPAPAVPARQASRRRAGGLRALAGDTRQRVALGVLAALAVLVGAALFPSSGVVHVPEVVGLPGEDARAVLADHDLGIVVTGYEDDTDLPDGIVTSADPRAGSPMTRGGVVEVVLSGPPQG
ncbi:MAG: protein kinase [Actinobacteria bacterium]|nr:protein kinase [Actinomycetota bacterium]